MFQIKKSFLQRAGFSGGGLGNDFLRGDLRLEKVDFAWLIQVIEVMLRRGHFDEHALLVRNFGLCQRRKLDRQRRVSKFGHPFFIPCRVRTTNTYVWIVTSQPAGYDLATTNAEPRVHFKPSPTRYLPN